MNNCILKRVLEELDYSPDASMCILQHEIYILEQLGIPLTFIFSWRMLGLYSSELEKEVDAINKDENKSKDDFHLKRIYKKAIKYLNNIISACPIDMDKEVWLTLVSFVAYEYEHCNLNLVNLYSGYKDEDIKLAKKVFNTYN